MNKDTHVVVRNVPVPKSLIEKLRKEFGATLVTDPSLLVKLDESLDYFIQTRGRKPDLNKEMFRLPGDTNWYTYAPLPVPLDLVLPGSKMTMQYEKKPVWFAIPRVFQTGTGMVFE